jgi:hypothetical protein
MGAGRQFSRVVGAARGGLLPYDDAAGVWVFTDEGLVSLRRSAGLFCEFRLRRVEVVGTRGGMEEGLRQRLGRGRVGRQMGLVDFSGQTLAAGREAIPFRVISLHLARWCDLSISLKAGTIGTKRHQRILFARIPARSGILCGGCRLEGADLLDLLTWRCDSWRRSAGRFNGGT